MAEDEEPQPRTEMEILEEAIQEAIHVSREEDGEETGLVTKWVLLVEVAQGDSTSLIFRAPPHIRPWEVEGMLSFILHRSNYGERAEE